MYAKIFRQMYEGSLVAAGWQAMIVFQNLLILADIDGVVDMSAESISRTTTIPLDIITAGIEILEQPDPESRTPAEDGRRLIRLSPTRSWGWRIVNYQTYRALRSGDDRREYHKQYWREVRSPKLKTQPDSTRTQQGSTLSTDAVSSKHRQREDAEAKAKDLKDPLRGRDKKPSRGRLKGLRLPDPEHSLPGYASSNGEGRSLTEEYDDFHDPGHNLGPPLHDRTKIRKGDR